MASRFSVSLTNKANKQFIGKVAIGSQEFWMVFDTGSSDIWIPSSHYVFPIGVSRKKYERTANYKGGNAQHTIRFADMKLTGLLGSDSIQLGSKTIERMPFFQIIRADPQDYYATHTFAGVIGLSFVGSSVSSNETIWQKMWDEGCLENPYFSLWFKRNQPHVINSVTNEGGFVTFGYIDPAHHIDDHVYELTTDDHRWMIPFDSITVDTTVVEVVCEGALIDSGTSSIRGPRNFITKLNKLICEKTRSGYKPNITFTLGEVVSSRGGMDYEVKNDNGEIISYVFKISDNDHMTIGLPLLMKYHTVFNFVERKIGFAMAA